MKQFILKIILFVAIIIGSQMVVVRFYPPPISNEVNRADTVLAAKPDVIYFGDSTNWVVHPTDTDRRYISMFLESLLPNNTIKTLTDPAYNPDIYLEYVRYLSRKAPTLKPLLIIPINMRSFSPDTDRRPEFQYQQAKGSLLFADTPLTPFLKFIFTIHAYPLMPISYEEFLSTPVYNGKAQAGTVRDYEGIRGQVFTDQNLQKLLVYFYLYDLSPNHRRVQALEKIAEIANSSSLPVLFYITPIDYETGIAYMGNGFQKQLVHNVRIITDSLKQKGHDVLDLSQNLHASQFAWKNAEFIYINEHLNDAGRMSVASHIKARIDTMLPK